MAGQQISPGIAHSLSRLCLSHLRSRLPCRYWTSKRLAFSSDVYASYVLPVRQASVLPSASFRFHLTVDTLAVRLMIPPAGVIGVLHSLASAPCRAHQDKNAPTSGAFGLNSLKRKCLMFGRRFAPASILRNRDFCFLSYA